MQDCRIGLRNRGICVVIPVFNNEATIVDVVRRTLDYCLDVFVVADGCTDGTLARLESVKDEVRLVVLPCNCGKGKALKAGFRAALDAGFAYAITLDADGQHYPEDIPAMLEANRANPGAIIVGCRSGLKDAARSAGSSFANSFSNFWFFLQTLHYLKDSQTGYRLYPLRKLKGLCLLTSRYEAELELLVFASWHGVKIVNSDVRVYYPPEGERVSHFRPFRDFARISLLNTVLCLLALVYGLPLTLIRTIGRALLTWTGVLLYVLSMILVVMPVAFCILRIGKKEKREARLHRLICSWTGVARRCSSLLGLRWKRVENAPLDFSRPAVIICNHQSHLDLLAMLSLSPRLVILTNNWVWNHPLYGFIIRRADFLPASEGMEKLTPRLKEIFEKGYSIVIYPEGTRSRDRSIGRFRQGAFCLADKLGADILPMVMYGSGIALPKHGRVLRPYTVQLEADARISPAELASHGENHIKRAAYMRDYYRRRYAETADRLEQVL